MAKTTKRRSTKTPAFKNIGIIYRPKKAEALQIAQDVTDWLLERKYKVHSWGPYARLHGTRKIKNKKDVASIDLFVVIGGDGTYLKAVRLVNGFEIPVLGINLGNLGFLTECRATEVFQTLERALTGQLRTQTRTMIEVTIKKKGQKPASFLALNDIVIERGPISRLINLAIYSEDHLVAELKADGLIVCTPTGSTAYNLASSGPIVHPEVHAVVITPICPHSLTNRPITLPDDKVITIKVNQSTQKAVFMVDGLKVADVRDADEVIVKRAPYPHFRLVTPTSSYFDVLRTKLNFGQRN
jgi:NAD+ kinase